MENKIKLGLVGLAGLTGLYVTIKGITKLVHKARSHSENNRKETEKTIDNVITSLQDFEENMKSTREKSRELVERIKRDYQVILDGQAQRQHSQNPLETITIPR